MPHRAPSPASESVLVEPVPFEADFEPTADFSVVPGVVATMTPSEPQEVLQDWMAGMQGTGNWLLGRFLEEDKAPTPTAALSATAAVEGLKDRTKGLAAGVMQLLKGLLDGTDDEGQHHSYYGQPFAPAAVEGLKDLAKGLATGVMQLLNGLLGGPGGEGQHNSHDGQPFAPISPTPAPPGAPPAPGTSLNGASGTSGSAFVVLLGVFALFTLLLRSGKFSWPSHEFIKPASALRPAIERPG
jgi:hypothetical protein